MEASASIAYLQGMGLPGGGWMACGSWGGCMKLPMMKAAATRVVFFAEGKEHRWARFDRSSTGVSQGIV